MSAELKISLSDIRLAVENSTGLAAAHLGTYPLHEHLSGADTWRGEVEVFKVTGRAQADRAYAWGWIDGNELRFHVVLNLPPIGSPADAVREAYQRGATQ